MRDLALQCGQFAAHLFQLALRVGELRLRARHGFGKLLHLLQEILLTRLLRAECVH